MAENTAEWVPGVDVAPLLQATPLSGPDAGAKARLTDGFVAVASEIEKLSGVSDEQPNWSLVTDQSRTYLVEKAKDLRIATYLVVAWAEGSGLDGARKGLDLLVGLLDGAWEQVFPPVEKDQARAGTLTWLSEQLAPRLTAHLAEAPSQDVGRALVDAFARYQAVVGRRFPTRPPALGPIHSVILEAQKADKLPAVAQSPAEAPAEPTSSDPVLQPISEQNPVGDDPKLTDEFDALYSEIMKLEALGETKIEWRIIRKTALEIISTKGKDLRCLAYWTYANLQLDGATGLREGLAGLVACAERYGDDIYPKRPKARAAALRWIGTRLEEDVATLLKRVPEEDLKAMHASLDAAEKVFGGRVASLEGIQRARGGLMGVKVLRSAPPPPPPPDAPPPDAPPSDASAPAAVAPRPPAAPPTAAVPAEFKEAVETLLEQARSVAHRGESGLSLRLRRHAMWLTSPELAQGRKFECDCPENTARLSVQRAFRQKDWADVLAQSEALVEGFPFCLDLTFWSARAAAELFDETVEVALASELVALLIRVPKLERGTDREGRPLASKEARAWISKHRGSTGTTTPAPEAPAETNKTTDAQDGAATPPAAAAAAPESLPPEVEKLFKDGKIEAAIGQASAVAVGLTGRLGFQRNLLVAERLLQIRSGGPLAFSMFRALVGQLRTGSLVQWEPAAGARCIRGYLKSAQTTKTKVDDAEQLFDELMLLDPSAAVGLV